MDRRILVVDDEAGIRDVLRAYLTNEGFIVDEAETGADALRKALSSEDAPSLILLDVGLPDLDGFEVLRLLRQRSDVYVILVSARRSVAKWCGLVTRSDSAEAR